jgi:predicted Zn finger-like uncharacterized protein
MVEAWTLPVIWPCGGGYAQKKFAWSLPASEVRWYYSFSYGSVISDPESLMDASVHCPHCQMSLSVPDSAAGKAVRCPGCSKTFVVPSGEDLLEETISSWIEQDVEEVMADRHHRVDENLVHKPRVVANTPTRPKPKPAQDEDQAPPSKVRRQATQVKRPTRPKASHDDEPDKDNDQYPDELHASRRQPHLVVRRADHLGVLFAFDARCLKYEGFRAAMPMRCVFSSNADHGSLIARPLVFIDRSLAGKVSLDKVIASHENCVLGDLTSRQIIKAMGRIESLPHPFDLPMPFSVGNKFAHLYVHCQTHDRSDGGITCEVLIPDSMCALEWLARVNGVCGKAYEMLERGVAMLHGQVWRQLSDRTRLRIVSWCKLHPREELRLYIADADFGRSDEGLAGLVVTDQRVVYCKYHHRGQVRRNTPNAAVLSKSDTKFANLTLVVGTNRSRMVKIHQSDIEPLAKELARSGESLKLVTT